MKTIFKILPLLLIACSAVAKPPTITFQDKVYILKSSSGTLFEFLPEEQNIENWTEMVTFNLYPNVSTGEDLAQVANNLIGLYKEYHAKILRTNSVPRTKKKEAEHYLAAIFPRKTYIEASFVRLAIRKETALSVVYSHRTHGERVGDESSAWLQANGHVIENDLMKWKFEKALRQIQKMSKSGSQEQ